MRTARVAIAVIAVITVCGSVQAQQTDTQHPRAQQPIGPVSASRPRVGYAGAPTPPVQVVQVVQPVFLFNQGVFYTSAAPFVVQPDGSVLVNFGSGYQRVLLPCARPRVVSTDPFGRDALGRIPDPPGIAALRPGAQGQASGNTPARSANACYRPTTQGSAEIVTQ